MHNFQSRGRNKKLIARNMNKNDLFIKRHHAINTKIINLNPKFM